MATRNVAEKCENVHYCLVICRLSLGALTQTNALAKELPPISAEDIGTQNSRGRILMSFVLQNWAGNVEVVNILYYENEASLGIRSLITDAYVLRVSSKHITEDKVLPRRIVRVNY